MTKSRNQYDDIHSEQYSGMTILRAKNGPRMRRVLYLNSYGMAGAWRMIRDGTYPGQHLWGCLELARMGYEIAMPEEQNPKSRFFNYRRQDRKHLLFVKDWLGRDGIVYSAHTVTFWIPFLRSLKLLKCPVVTLLYARGEGLKFVKGYHGVIAMTPAASERAMEIAPQAKHAYLRWGVDLPFFPTLEYTPKWFLSCGKTRRDFRSLASAATNSASRVRVLNPDLNSGIAWPENTNLITERRGGGWYSATYRELIEEHYAGCAAALILLDEDSTERYAAGFTQLLEAMALGIPVIVTKTGAIAREVDVEAEKCGIFVPPNNPTAIASAMESIASNPERGAAMGNAGRALCERRYNIVTYAAGLNELFKTL